MIIAYQLLQHFLTFCEGKKRGKWSIESFSKP